METIQQIIAGIYARLRRPSEARLHYKDVQEQVNDLLRLYVQEENLSLREAHTVKAGVTPELQDNGDYLIRVPNVPDFEPVMLEYTPEQLGSVDNQAWYEIQLVPLHAWAQHFTLNRVSASFYGALATSDGQFARLNLADLEVNQAQFRLTYREPLLALLQLGEQPPLPANFLPMLKIDGALNCAPLVNDDSEEWTAWWERTRPQYEAQSLQWRNPQRTGLWQRYLQETQQPPVMDVKPFNAQRMVGRYARQRAYMRAESQ